MTPMPAATGATMTTRSYGCARSAVATVRMPPSWAWYSASSSCPEAMSVPATEPADVPMITPAAARSMPSPASPAIRPVSQAMPVTPPPPRTSARLSVTVIHPPQRTPGPRTIGTAT